MLCKKGRGKVQAKSPTARGKFTRSEPAVPREPQKRRHNTLNGWLEKKLCFKEQRSRLRKPSY